MFKLNEEQIEEIINEYGGSRSLIKNIEEKLNFLDVIQEEDDYLDIVISVVSQRLTNNEEVKRCNNKKDAIKKFISIDEFIVMELNRKYNDFYNAKEETKQKIKKFIQPKIRHD